MPNQNKVNGFRPHIEGQGRVVVTSHGVLVGNARIITQNDAVSAVVDGNVYGNAVTRGNVNDGNILCGVASHFWYLDSNVARPSARIPASQAGRCYVFDDPTQKFIGAGCGASSRTATVASQLTDLGGTVLLGDGVVAVSYATPQGTYGGASSQGLDMDSLGTAQQDFQLLERYDVTNNAFGSSTTDNLNGQYVFRFLEHYFPPLQPTPGL